MKLISDFLDQIIHGDWQCERHCFGLSGDDLVVGVDQLNPNLVLPDRQTRDVDRVVIAGVHPPPRQVVNGDVQMPDSR